MIRLFIAFPIQPTVQQQLGELMDELRTHDDSVKWVTPGNIHVTIRFLGDTDEKLVPEIKAAIDQIAEQFTPTEANINRLGGFPSVKRPRVLWAGLEGSLDILSDLAEKMEKAVRKLGFEKETKKFRPHITLGRIRHGGISEALIHHLSDHQPDPITISFDRVALVKSTLTPKGPIYENLHEVLLK